MHSSHVSRRSFLACTGAAAVLSAASWSRVHGAGNKLRVASVGTGGKGTSDLNGVAASPEVQVVGLCDIDPSEKHLGWAAKKFTDAKTYADWRRLIDDEKNFDALIVSTPDHMHAPVALPAMQLRKHIFCQKPLTHTVHEARQMRKAAAKYNLVTQMGNQVQSSENYRTAVKLVHDGAIGKVKAVHSWQAGGVRWRLVDDRPAGSDPIPAGLNWDNWLGVAKERPFKEKLYHSFNWRAWQDFSNGQLGDFGCHILDPVFLALKLTAPSTILAKAAPMNNETWSKWSTVDYTFPGTELTAGSIPVTWYDGEGQLPPAEVTALVGSMKLPGSGSILIGEKGNLLIPHGSAMPKLLPEEKFASYKIDPQPKGDHYVAWADACRGIGKTVSNFDYAGNLTESVLLGTIAIRRPGETLTWDAEKLTFANNAAATTLVTKPYRKGWEPAWV